MQGHSFKAYGHPNIRATHATTFEFTKDPEVTPTGDCIVGVKADFDFPKLDSKKVIITMTAGNLTERATAILYDGFIDKEEMVVRKSDFLSDRTFAIHSDKAAADFSEGFREKLSDPSTIIEVRIDEAQTDEKG
jgi:hypothetical protein